MGEIKPPTLTGADDGPIVLGVEDLYGATVSDDDGQPVFEIRDETGHVWVEIRTSASPHEHPAAVAAVSRFGAAWQRHVSQIINNPSRRRSNSARFNVA